MQSHFRQQLINAVDSVKDQMQRRFEQPALHLYASIENVLLKSFKRAHCEDDSTEQICNHFGDVIDQPALIRQLSCLQNARKGLAAQTTADDHLPAAETVPTLINYLCKLGPCLAMFSEVAKLLHLHVLMSVPSVTAERSFSGLRRLKTFLRTSMSQKLLNSIAILHVHKALTREIDISKAAAEFISRSEHRLLTFGAITSV